MGSILEALLAGYMPKTIPIIAEKMKATTTQTAGTEYGKLMRRTMPFAARSPRNMPRKLGKWSTTATPR